MKSLNLTQIKRVSFWRLIQTYKRKIVSTNFLQKKAAKKLAAFFEIASNYFPLLTEPAKSEPALNFTTFLAAILISLPV